MSTSICLFFDYAREAALATRVVPKPPSQLSTNLVQQMTLTDLGSTSLHSLRQPANKNVPTNPLLAETGLRLFIV